MMALMDRNEPLFRVAMDRAARVAEHSLEHRNDEAAQEVALDILNDYAGDLYFYFWGGSEFDFRDPLEALAWAFALTERQTELRPHEEKLLELAWEKVRDDAVQAEWERMGMQR